MELHQANGIAPAEVWQTYTSGRLQLYTDVDLNLAAFAFTPEALRVLLFANASS